MKKYKLQIGVTFLILGIILSATACSITLGVCNPHKELCFQPVFGLGGIASLFIAFILLVLEK